MQETTAPSWQHQDYLFPQVPDRVTSPEELLRQYDLAHWSVTALENALLQATTVRDRATQCRVSNDLHQVEGITKVIVRRGVDRGILSPEL